MTLKVVTTTPYHVTYENSERYEVEWPEGWPIPRENEEVQSKDGTPLFVRHVIWYPHGEFGEDSEPFVHIVLWDHTAIFRDSLANA